MKFRSFLVGLYVCTLTSVLSYADNVISKINLEGLRNVKEKTVLSEIKLKKNSVYSVESAKNAVGSIIKLGYFDECTFIFDGNSGVLTFSIVEKPYVESIAFRGNVEFSDNKLKNASVLKRTDFYDILKLEESKKKILKLYEDKGYANCVIEVYPTVNVDTNRMIVTFLITENSKVLIGDVKIEGVISYSKRKILKLMKKIRSKKIFKDESYQKDLSSIESFYKNNGFIDYKLVSSTVSFNESKTEMFLILNISEGVKYKIGEIAFDGNSVLKDKKLKKTIEFKKGQVFNEQKIVETKQNLVDCYADKGYSQAQIVPDFHKFGDIVNIVWNIKENSIVYVGNIYIEGLESTKEKVIRREVLLKSEDILSRKKLIKSVQRIRNLGFIDDVKNSLSHTGDPNVMDLTFEITEGRAGMITAGAGLSSASGLFFNIGLTHMNLFGLGQHFNLSFEGSPNIKFCGMSRDLDKYEALGVSWTEPYIFDKNTSLTSSIFHVNKKKNYAGVDSAFNERKKGFSISVGPRIGTLVKLMFGYKLEHVTYAKIKDEVRGKIDLNSLEGRACSVFAQIVCDSLDYVYDPTRGNRQLLRIDLAGSYLGGNVNHVKACFKSDWFLPVFWKFVFSTSLRVEAVAPYGYSLGIRPSDLLYLGGPEDIRGYDDKKQIGPNDGGRYKSVLNFEYKFPIVMKGNNSVLVGVFFYDVGGLWGRRGTIKWFGTGDNNLYSSLGFELRVTIPAFPIRIGCGYKLNYEKKKFPYDFYFSIGTPV